MDTSTSYILIIAISVLFFSFFNKLGYLMFDGTENVKSKIFMSFIVLGVIGVITSINIESTNVSAGIAVGSLLLILNAVFMYWNEITETGKLLLMGSGLVALIYTANQLYKGAPIIPFQR